MEPDFPAAHSMDTTWFAVDREGHVASFHSGENGAVATAAARELPEETLAGIAPCEPILDWDGYRAMGQPRHEFEHLGADEDGSLLMFLPEPMFSDEHVKRHGGRLLQSTAKCALWLPREARAEIDALHGKRGCLRCVVLYDRSAGGLFPGAWGLYHYEHVGGGSTPLPYVRLHLPSRPLVVDALPKALREKVLAVRFDTDFATQRRLQPFAFGPATAYGGDTCAWLDEDGQAHPIPDCEEEFRKVWGSGD